MSASTLRTTKRPTLRHKTSRVIVPSSGSTPHHNLPHLAHPSPHNLALSLFQHLHSRVESRTPSQGTSKSSSASSIFLISSHARISSPLSSALSLFCINTISTFHHTSRSHSTDVCCGGCSSMSQLNLSSCRIFLSHQISYRFLPFFLVPPSTSHSSQPNSFLPRCIFV